MRGGGAWEGGGGGEEGGYFNEASRENKQWASVHMHVVCMCVFMHRTNDCIVTALDYHTHTHTHTHTLTCTHTRVYTCTHKYNTHPQYYCLKLIAQCLK